jgi:hypothetical protein
MAVGVDAFGQLVHDEADPAKHTGSADVQALRAALDGLHEARARLDDLLMSPTAPELVELHAAVLSTVKRLLREMDLDERIRRQVRLLRPPRPPLAPGTVPPSSRPATTHEPSEDAETQLLPRHPGERRDKRRP